MKLRLYPLYCLILLYFPSILFAQNDWENWEVFEINKLPPRAAWTPYLDEAEALTFQPDNATYRRS